MAFTMNGRKWHRQIQCTVDRCRNRDTIQYFRGSDGGQNPMHLCSDCVHDIVAKYVEIAGVDAAREKLADVLELLKPEEVEETPGETEETVEETVEEAEETAETPKRGRRRKEDTE